jgi:hypothetical protein
MIRYAVEEPTAHAEVGRDDPGEFGFFFIRECSMVASVRVLG